MTLLERLQAATGPDRQLDREIEEALPGVLRHFDHRMVADGYVISGDFHPQYSPGQAYLPAHYTGSLDAALALMPDTHAWSLLGGREKVTAFAVPRGEWMFLADQCEGATLAIALTIAALKARGIE